MTTVCISILINAHSIQAVSSFSLPLLHSIAVFFLHFLLLSRLHLGFKLAVVSDFIS